MLKVWQSSGLNSPNVLNDVQMHTHTHTSRLITLDGL